MGLDASDARLGIRDTWVPSAMPYRFGAAFRAQVVQNPEASDEAAS